MQNNFVPER